MKKRILIMTLAVLVAFAMLPLHGFADTKTIVETSAETYRYVDGNEYLTDTTKNIYNKKAQLTKSKAFSREYYRWDEPGTENDPDDPYYLDYNQVDKYTYDKKGRMKTNLTYEEGELRSKITKKYDSKGRIIKTSYYYYDNDKDKFNLLRYFVYTYSKKKETTKLYDSDDVLTSKIVDTLNSKKQTIKSVDKTYDNGRVTYTTTTEFKYWKNGQIRKMIYKSENSSSTDYYNKKGQLTKSTWSYEDEDGQSVYKYDKYGRMIEEKTTYTAYTDDDEEGGINEGEFITTYKYKGYYKNRQHPKTVLEYSNGKLIGKTVYKYKSI